MQALNASLNLHAGDVLRGELVGILGTLRSEKEREITKIAQTDFLEIGRASCRERV